MVYIIGHRLVIIFLGLFHDFFFSICIFYLLLFFFCDDFFYLFYFCRIRIIVGENSEVGPNEAEILDEISLSGSDFGSAAGSNPGGIRNNNLGMLHRELGTEVKYFEPYNFMNNHEILYNFQPWVANVNISPDVETVSKCSEILEIMSTPDSSRFTPRTTGTPDHHYQVVYQPTTAYSVSKIFFEKK